MARKNPGSTQSHALNDVFGVILAASSLLLMLALLSFDRRDVADAAPVNNPLHNLGGPIGAHVAHWLFMVFGGAAFVIPVLLLIFAFGYLLQFMSYLQRRWIWGVALLFCCMGLMSSFENDLGLLSWLQRRLNAPSAGGFIGHAFYQYGLRYVGKLGAAIVLGTVYIVSLLYLTNFKLGEWCRQMVGAATPDSARTSSSPSDAKDLERRARDLEKQARKLQEQLDKTGRVPKAAEPSGLGPDMKPVPAPQVRDLTVPQQRADNGQKSPSSPPTEPAKESRKEPAPADEGMVITAREIAAATSADILGKPKATATE